MARASRQTSKSIKRPSATRASTERQRDTPEHCKAPSSRHEARPQANYGKRSSTISKARRRSLERALSSGAVDVPEFGVLKEWGDYVDRVLLDYDERHTRFVRGIWAVCRIVGVRPLVLRLDRTRRGWHCVIVLNRAFTRGELVAFQACCGSDLRREALNLMRVVGIRTTPIRSKFWRDRWNILYSEKVK